MTEETATNNPITQAFKDASADQIDEFTKLIINALLPTAVENLRESLPSIVDRFLEERGYSSDIAGMVHLLAARSNDAKEEVLRKALTLYGLALDAREKGNRLVILDKDNYIVHEILGFDTATGPSQKVAS